MQTVKMLVLTIAYHAPNESLLCAAKKMLQVLCKVNSLNLLLITLNTTSFFVMVRVIIIINRKPESTSFHSNCCIFIYLDYSKSETDVFFKQQSSVLQWSTRLNFLYKIQDVWTTMKRESSCHLPGFQSGSAALVHNCCGTWEGLFISQGCTQLLNCCLDRNA